MNIFFFNRLKNAVRDNAIAMITFPYAKPDGSNLDIFSVVKHN